MLWRAVVVECSFLKPCCVCVFGMFSVMWGSMIFSKVLAIGDRRDIGLYEVPSSGFLFGFRIGTIFASFHISGIELELRDSLNILQRYSMAMGPRCFRCFMFILSGPVELLFLDALIAEITCSVVISMRVDFSFFVISVCFPIFFFCCVFYRISELFVESCSNLFWGDAVFVSKANCSV